MHPEGSADRNARPGPGLMSDCRHARVMATLAARAKHGIARSVGVFGTPGSGGPEQFFELLARCTRLRAWASGHGVTLADDPVSLPVLDRHLDAWNAQPPTHPFLEPEIGCCVGTVIVRHVPGSRWRVLAQRSPGSATTIRR